LGSGSRVGVLRPASETVGKGLGVVLMEILKKVHWGKRADRARKVMGFFQGPLASREMRWIILGLILLVFLVVKLQYNPYPVGEKHFHL